MRLTRRQLRSLILREVRLLAEQAAEESQPGQEEYQARWDEMNDRWEGSRDQADEAFLWLVQTGELDGELDREDDIMGLDVTPDGALELAVWWGSQSRSSEKTETQDFRVVPVERRGQPVMYAALAK